MNLRLQLRYLASRYVPQVIADRLRPVTHWPPPVLVRWGSFRRLKPVSPNHGWDRGTPIDRHYIEDFLRSCSDRGDIRGRALEVKSDMYTSRFSTPSSVVRIDIVDRDVTNAASTIVGDLTLGSTLPRETFDCIICTQTIHVIYDFRAVLASLQSALRPAGVLLLTMPGVSAAVAEGDDGDYWRFTTTSVRLLLEELFSPEQVSVCAYGNVLTAAAFLYGLAAGELRPSELAFHDPRYEVLIAARAMKSISPE